MFGKHLTSTALFGWIAAWLAVAALILAATASADSDDIVPLHATGEGTATLDGLTAQLQSVAVSGIETTVDVDFLGRDADGDTVELAGRSALRLDDGTILDERSGSVDGRNLALQFDPVPADRTIVELVLTGVSLRPLANPDDLTTIGSFTLGVAPELVSHTNATVRQLDESAPFGPGEIVVTGLVASDGQLTITGRFADFTGEQLVQELILDTPTLTLPDGSAATYVGTRIGFGETPDGFGMTFSDVPALAEGEARLSVSTTPESAIAASAALTLELP